MPELTFCPIGLSYVAPCYFDQRDHGSLFDLLRFYQSFDAELLDRIEFVFVDDGSPQAVRLPEELELNVLLLRINEDIRWNQAGARNLGVVYCRSDKVLVTDIDHEFSENTLHHMLEMPPLGKTMYKPQRLNEDGSPGQPHPNTFFMSRARFLKYHGYDEEFCGAYCYEDGMFWRWQRYNGTRFRYLDKRYPARRRQIDRQHSYHSLVRDKSRNRLLRDRKKAEVAEYGSYGMHSRQFLNFTWQIVERRTRTRSTWQPPVDRGWKKRFWLRWLGNA